MKDKIFSIHYNKNEGSIKVFFDNKLIIDYKSWETYTEYRDVLDSIIIMAKYSKYMYELIADGEEDRENLLKVIQKGYFES